MMHDVIRDSVIELAELSSVLLDSLDAANVKVSVIREALHLGRYRTHSQCIARKMLELSHSTQPQTAELVL